MAGKESERVNPEQGRGFFSARSDRPLWVGGGRPQMPAFGQKRICRSDVLATPLPIVCRGQLPALFRTKIA